uniref:GOLD domain-containing protein n=1 Tax=Rhabditophanes sp. KR3021 TaxID=114890 RepID=A0AC35U898_9BILA
MNVYQVLLFTSLLLHVSSSEFGLTIQIPAGNFQCFFQPVEKEAHKFIEIDFQVVDGGDLNINFMVILGADVIVQAVMQKEGTHRLPVKALGDYQICFDNTFSYQQSKSVFFEVYLLDEQGNLDEEDIGKFVKTDPQMSEKIEKMGIAIGGLRESFEKIKQSLNRVEYHQALIRAYESRDRAIMNANSDRVTLWSILNSIVICGVSAMNIYMIKSMFDDKSSLGRILRNKLG